MGIKTKVFLTVTISTFLTVGIIVLWVSPKIKENFKDNIKTQNFTILESTLDIVDRVLYEKHIDINVIADEEEFEKILTNQKDKSIENAKDKLQELYINTGPWNYLTIVTPKKEIVLSTTDEEINERHSAIIEKALTGKTQYSDVAIDIETNTPTLYIATPIRDQKSVGQPIIGVAFGELPWKVIEEIINKYTYPIYMINSNSEIIASSTKTTDIKNLEKYTNSQIVDAQKNLQKLFIEDSGHNGTKSLITYTFEKGYLDYKGNNWGIVMEEPIKDIYKPFYNLIYIFIGIALLLAIIGALVKTILLTKILVTPLQRLTSEALTITKGDLNKRSSLNSRKDEIGMLANAFNNMTQKIQNNIENIESVVKEKTKKLEETTLQLDDRQKAMLNVLDDVSREKQIAQEAIIDLQKFQLAVESSSDHMIITDPEGVILYGNKTVEKITGFTLKEITGKKAGVKELWGGLMEKEFYRELWETIKTKKQPFAGRINNKRRNGELYVADTHIIPILGHNNEVVFFVGIERDITKEVQVDKMKNEFISLASHQLRTPLSAMKWYLEMLLTGDAGKLTKEQIEFIKNIDMSNERMIELVNALLNVSRIDSGKIIVDPVPTNIKDLINEVMMDLGTKFKDKKIKPLISVSDTIPSVNLDSKLIRQVFMNLLTNAIKYTPEKGEISVFVSKEKKNLLIQVTDSGYGIPEKDKDKVFTKFYRGENITKSETDGNGLGLYLIKAIVESSNGEIWYKSKENEGTTFWFTLPIKGMEKKQGSVSIDS